MLKTHRLKQLRKSYVKPNGKTGLTFAELEKLTGIPKSTLGEYERYHAIISPDRVKILCEVFQCDESVLFVQPKN
jgi:transcriptional regulator with XRE-family HTH domain